MGIEIYDKAAVIEKDGTIYYLVKQGSKNCSTCAWQTVTDNNFRDKYLRGEARESDWHLIAYGTPDEHERGTIGETWWNCPTSTVYGQIRFGNKLNIAYYLARQTPKPFEAFDAEQRRNIEAVIQYGLDNPRYNIALSQIDALDESKRFSDEVWYCGDPVRITPETSTVFNGRQYWALDNL